MIRRIYTVDMAFIETWNEEENWPMDIAPITSIGDEEWPAIFTTDLLKAYSVYLKHADVLDDENYIYLTATEVEVTEEAWAELTSKENLEYSDYCDYICENSLQDLAWKWIHDGYCKEEDDVLGEIVRDKSEYFNMRVICEKAGIVYSTFRGFKNNRLPFSKKKMLQLLKCMNNIGLNCWNECLNKEYKQYIN